MPIWLQVFVAVAGLMLAYTAALWKLLLPFLRDQMITPVLAKLDEVRDAFQDHLVESARSEERLDSLTGNVVELRERIVRLEQRSTP